MIQLTPIHNLLWEIICLGGLISIKRLFPLLTFLVDSGRNRIALEIVRIPLNLIYVKELRRLISKVTLWEIAIICYYVENINHTSDCFGWFKY